MANRATPFRTGFDLADLCNFLRPAPGQAQQHRQEDDDEEKIEHGEPRAVSNIRSIAVHAVNETRHPPGPPAVTLITMSASVNLKMILMMRTVMLTGSMIGNVTCQNDCHPLAPSTLAASSTSLGIACSPASKRIMMKGIETQASIASMLNRAAQGEAKNAGLSHPRLRASVAAGPKRYSMRDLPIIQLTATGL